MVFGLTDLGSNPWYTTLKAYTPSITPPLLLVHIQASLSPNKQTTETVYTILAIRSITHCVTYIIYLTNSSWHYGPGCHLQNIIWTEVKLRSIYSFVGDRSVHKLPFGPKCHDLFVILYSIHAYLSDDMFLLLYI